jgi:hypothetical protein
LLSSFLPIFPSVENTEVGAVPTLPIFIIQASNNYVHTKWCGTKHRTWRNKAKHIVRTSAYFICNDINYCTEQISSQGGIRLREAHTSR